LGKRISNCQNTKYYGTERNFFKQSLIHNLPALQNRATS
jgi:hypothetical protein